MRGAPTVDWPSEYRTGIIPARAGSTTDAAGRRRRWRDHPRSCGEHIHLSRGHHTRPGSSPLVRGALSRERSRILDGRIIPARAGSTYMAGGNAHRQRDHPRSCGEHSSFIAFASAMRGSSPLVRGAPLRNITQNLREGIIPARAGSTQDRQRDCRLAKDHPRSCGEHFTMASFGGAVKGSSPLVRGALCGWRYRWSCCRIIPARAGSTNQAR